MERGWKRKLEKVCVFQPDPLGFSVFYDRPVFLTRHVGILLGFCWGTSFLATPVNLFSGLVCSKFFGFPLPPFPLPPNGFFLCVLRAFWKGYMMFRKNTFFPFIWVFLSSNGYPSFTQTIKLDTVLDM